VIAGPGPPGLWDTSSRDVAEAGVFEVERQRFELVACGFSLARNPSRACVLTSSFQLVLSRLCQHTVDKSACGQARCRWLHSSPPAPSAYSEASPIAAPAFLLVRYVVGTRTAPRPEVQIHIVVLIPATPRRHNPKPHPIGKRYSTWSGQGLAMLSGYGLSDRLVPERNR
jgi:hypothetical protein